MLQADTSGDCDVFEDSSSTPSYLLSLDMSVTNPEDNFLGAWSSGSETLTVYAESGSPVLNCP
jgi:hypothetical protein